MQYRIPLTRKDEALDLLRAEPFCPTPQDAERLLSLMVVMGKDLVLDTSLLPRRREQSRSGNAETANRNRSRASRMRSASRVVRRTLHAAKSVAKTTLGIDRATDEQVEARLNVCRSCPGNHATWTPGKGDVHTCGPMLESMKRDGTSGVGTRGCILRKKARDLAENCPFGWWPPPTTGTTREIL